MPFMKVGINKYKSPSGRTFTKKQVKMYYANNGFKKKKLPTRKQLIKEHKELVKVLRSGSKSERQKESKEQSKELKSYQKMKIMINNKLKGSYGGAEFKNKKPTGKILINLKAHNGDKKELASTIKHEMLHVKHPKMTEKQIYKKSKKTSITPQEQTKLLAKLKMKKVNYKVGALKRKLNMGANPTKPGDFISKANSNKTPKLLNTNKPFSLKQVAIRGLV